MHVTIISNMKKEKKEDLEEAWDKKKLFVAAIVATIFLTGGIFFLGSKVKGVLVSPTSKVNSIKQKVLGSETKNKDGSQAPPEVRIPPQEEVQRIIKETQEILSKLTTENITSSQAAIQQIITNFQQLQGGKKDTKDVFCDLVCKDK